MTTKNNARNKRVIKKSDIWTVVGGLSLLIFAIIAGLELKHKNDIRSGYYSEDYVYAYEKAELHGESPERSKEYAQIYVKVLGSTQDTIYAKNYIDALVAKKQSESYARNYARAIVDGNSKEYAQIYARTLEYRKASDVYARNYARAIVDGNSKEYAQIYARTLEYRKASDVYARNYARAIVDGNSKEYADAYAQALDSGKSISEAKKIAEEERKRIEEERIAREAIRKEEARKRQERQERARAERAEREAEKARRMKPFFILMFNYQTVHMGKSKEYATFFATFYAEHRVNGVEHYPAIARAGKDMAVIGY